MNYPLIGGALLLLFGSCLNSSEDEDLDVQPPTISAPTTTGNIAPAHFIEVPPDADHIPVAFAVADGRGLSEIVLESHNGFDGHVHGKSVNDFVLLSYRHTLTGEALADPLRFESQADEEPTIYLDDRNPRIPTDGLVLAGPYHFSIKAVDESGNETSYADNSTYHTTFYLQRHYAPQLRVDGIDRATGTVSGEVWRNEDDAASGEIVFLWAYIVTPDPATPAQEGEVKAEWLWGQSNWPHQFRADSGEPLPDGERLDLSELLGNQKAIQQMNASDRLHLWAEDENGNISVRTFQ